MFVERFDALMNIAELSNSQLGREISMNPSRASDGCAPVHGLCRSTTSFCPGCALIWQRTYLAGMIRGKTAQWGRTVRFHNR